MLICEGDTDTRSGPISVWPKANADNLSNQTTAYGNAASGTSDMVRRSDSGFSKVSVYPY